MPIWSEYSQNRQIKYKYLDKMITIIYHDEKLLTGFTNKRTINLTGWGALHSVKNGQKISKNQEMTE